MIPDIAEVQVKFEPEEHNDKKYRYLEVRQQNVIDLIKESFKDQQVKWSLVSTETISHLKGYFYIVGWLLELWKTWHRMYGQIYSKRMISTK